MTMGKLDKLVLPLMGEEKGKWCNFGAISGCLVLDIQFFLMFLSMMLINCLSLFHFILFANEILLSSLPVAACKLLVLFQGQECSTN